MRRIIECCLLTALLASGCRKPVDANPPDNKPGDDAVVKKPAVDELPKKPVEPTPFDLAVKKVKDREADKIDVLPFKKISDQDLRQLKDLSYLRRLTLDNAPVTSDGMKELAGLIGIEYLSLCNTDVNDAGLAALKDLASLEVLRLDKLRITDGGLAHVKAFPRVKHLSLWRTPITDEGLVHLKDLANLQHLSVDETRVGDEGLKHLQGLTNLRYLSVWRTKVTDDGVNELKQKLPKLRVNRGT